MAKAYRTVTSEALCVVTGMTPIHIKIEETAKLYHHTRGHIKDKEHFENKEARHCQHPAEATVKTPEGVVEDSPLQIYTDGSKTGKGVGSGIVIYRYGQNIKNLQCKLNKKCTIKQNN